MAKTTPCDFGECPYDAQYSEHCRVFCGLGVDEACDESEFDDDCYGMDEDMELLAHLDGRSGHGDYSPSAPWNAPGMSIKDFI